MFKTVQILFLLYPQSHTHPRTETVPPHSDLHSIHMEGFGFDKVAYYRDKLLLHTYLLHPSVQDVPGWGSPQKPLLLSPLTPLCFMFVISWILGGGAGEIRVNTKTISQIFCISKLFLLHTCNSNVFILLHEIPNHFYVQK